MRPFVILEAAGRGEYSPALYELSVGCREKRGRHRLGGYRLSGKPQRPIPGPTPPHRAVVGGLIDSGKWQQILEEVCLYLRGGEQCRSQGELCDSMGTVGDK